ncbi:DNA-binding transcriptional regulator, LysR family [Actinopolyspora xinjiangensis]|uniref:DNA-binding transcriptional regulator, LysR family n=1 Tax=Actinopolyspora xinjiangensis TaxID=405564 RepID=A0A1H0V4G8_9ACTN|nr:LysR family transcriptional regulator [Actinopolyspora xinjiangensis]SDP73439.1 DNA-binding transcriptional regulator, LysR family [Actinopolyspora xinjiangensis]
MSSRPLPRSVRDLTGYELLLSVAELGSIGQAARRHDMSQPAASARLRQLEADVGTALLERRPRGTRLTTAGELVASWAQATVEAASDLAAGITALRADHHGHVRIAASLTVAEYLLPRWLIALRAADPETVVALDSGNSAEVEAGVLAGSADIGFVEGPEVASGLSSREVARDELALVVAPSHPWAGRRRNPRAAELAATSLVSRERGSGTRLALERALAERFGLETAEPVLEVSSTTAIKAAVTGGIGPAVLSARAVVAELAAGTLVRLDVTDLDLTRSLRAVWPEGAQPRGPARDLLAIALREQ